MTPRYISLGEAARILGLGKSTVRNMLEDGRLVGIRGHQPERPRWRVEVDETGNPIQTGGDSKGAGSSTPQEEIIVDLEVERLRESAILLNSFSEKFQAASALQTQANALLHEAIAEQSRVIATLLIPDNVPASVSLRE